MSAVAGAEARTRSLAAPSFGLAVVAVLGATSAAGLLPPMVAGVAAVLLFAVAGTLPLLARVTTVVPSLQKLALLSALLSPVVATAIHLAAQALLGREHALTATFAVFGVIALLGTRRSVELPRPGRGQLLALGLGILCAALVALFLFRGSAPRGSFHGLLHSAVLFAVDRAVPPSNPWMAGEPLGYYWFWHGMGALFARALGVAPTYALALLNLWAAALLPLALYFAAAPWMRSARRELAGVLLALFGLNALGGFLWAAEGFPLASPQSPMELFAALQASVGAWDPRLAFGLSKLGNLSSYPAALALYAGTLFAGVHALRSGARPWVGVTAALAGSTLVVNPVVGALAVGSAGLAALLFATEARMRLVVALGLGAIPGLLLVALASGSYPGESHAFAWREGVLWATAAPLLLLLAAALGNIPGRAEREPSTEGDARARRLLVVAVLFPLALHLVLLLPYDNQYKLVRVAALPAGLLASAGLARLLGGGGTRRAVGLGLGAALVVGALLVNTLGLASYLSLSTRDLPLVEGAGRLAPRPTPADPEGSEELAQAYGWLASRGAVETDAVLVVNTVSDDAASWGAPEPHRFTDPARNLQGHEAAPFTGLSLFCDRPSQVLHQATEGWTERIGLLVGLYLESRDLSREELASLRGLDRPVYALTGGADVARQPGLEAKLGRAGFTPVAVFGRTRVHRLDGSGAAPESGR